MASETTLQEFESVFPRLEADLIEWAKGYNLPQEQLDWYKKVSLLDSFTIHTPYLTLCAVDSFANMNIPIVPRDQRSRRKMQPRHVSS